MNNDNYNVPWPRIYKGNLIRRAFLKEPYFKSFFIKIKIYSIENQYFKTVLPGGLEFLMECPEEFISKLIINDEYIISLYNRYHQSYLFPVVLGVHFNSTRRELIEPWHPYQIAEWAKEMTFNEDGVPFEYQTKI